MTMQIPIGELIEKTENSMYKLVILASRRAIELNAGAPRLIEENIGKAGSIALEEIRQGKVKLKEKIEQR